MTERVIKHEHTTGTHVYIVRYHLGNTLDAMWAVQRWADHPELDFEWADANVVLESMYQLWERNKLQRSE